MALHCPVPTHQVKSSSVAEDHSFNTDQGVIGVACTCNYIFNLFTIIGRYVTGVAQGVVTGIRGLCNGLGPALFGFVFYVFDVDLNDKHEGAVKSNIMPEAKHSTASPQHSSSVSSNLHSLIKS